MNTVQPYVFSLMVSCTLMMASPAQGQSRDACGLLRQNVSWAGALKTATQKWRVSPGTMLAVIDQESRFVAAARGQGAGGENPVRNFGYAQANLRTWNWFLRETGRASGARTNFALSVDFVGWHFSEMETRIGVPRTNVVAHYLVYKMGEGGYKRGAPATSHALAQRIAARADMFDGQLQGCPL